MDRRAFIRAVGIGIVGSSTGCLGREDRREPETARDGSDGDSDTTVTVGIDRVIRVSGQRYEFTPGSEDPIVAEHGEDVRLSFRALDDGYHGGHGLAIDAYGIDLRAQEGEEVSTAFTADQAGEFEVYCSVYCGEGHPGMEGTFVVRDPPA